MIVRASIHNKLRYSPLPKLAWTSLEESIIKASVVRAAWALVLARYSDSDDVTFGSTVSSRTAPVAGLESMVGPALATVPVRVRVDPAQSILSFLRSIQSQAFEMTSYEQFGLQNIAKPGQDAKEACDFTSLFLAQPAAGSDEARENEPLLSMATDKLEDAMEGNFNYPLVAEGVIFDNAVEFSLVYNSYALSDDRLEALSDHLESVITQLLQTPDKSIGEVNIAGSWDTDRIATWNSHEPEYVDACLHDLVSKQARKTPGKEAIFTTARTVSYHEMESLSNKLANYLVSLGVTKETPIPICFEKSEWPIVAMLGVMKAGGVFVPLDPSHPLNRRHEICGQVDAKYILVSPTTKSEFTSTAPHVIELSQAAFAKMPGSATALSKRTTPKSAAYILFSSGSTGKPKGIMVDHAAISTSTVGQVKSFAVEGQPLRFLQFASFAFDVNLFEIFIALVIGGTVCMPTESERLETTADFMTRSRTNAAMLSPSFARTIKPAQVPSLKVLMLMGEAPGKDNVETWFGRVRLINGYGPTEACVICVSHAVETIDTAPTNIGQSIAHTAWVLEPDDHTKLTPVGCIGDLVIQGHATAR